MVQIDKRQKAVNWWFNLLLRDRKQLSRKYYPNQTFKAVQRAGILIETIYEQENKDK